MCTVFALLQRGYRGITILCNSLGKSCDTPRFREREKVGARPMSMKRRLFNAEVVSGSVHIGGRNYYPFHKARRTLHTLTNTRFHKRVYRTQKANTYYDGHLDGCLFSCLYLMQPDWSIDCKKPFYSMSFTLRETDINLVTDILYLYKKIRGPNLRSKRNLASWGLSEWSVFMTEEYYMVSVEQLI